MTFAQAQERAERWVNGDVPAALHREVRVREFDLGFVAWAEDRDGGPPGAEGSGGGPAAEGGRARLVIARDSGETTLWPGLPVGEVIRRYEEEYGAAVDGGGDGAPPQRIDLEATSFLLTPPEWLQEAADARGVAEQRGAGGAQAPAAPPAVPAPAHAPEASASDAWAEVSVNGTDGAAAQSGAQPAETGPGAGASGVPTPWADADTTSGAGGEDRSVGLPATVFAPPLAGFDEEDDAPSAPRSRPEAKTELLHGGSQLPRTQVSPALPEDGARPGGGPLPPPMPPAPPAAAPLPDLPPPSGVPVTDVPPPPGAGTPAAAGPGVPPPAAPPAPPAGGGVHAAATMLADGSALPGNAAAGPPPPPAAPGPPGAGRDGAPQQADGGPAASGPGAPGGPAGGYVPTQLVSQLDAADVDLSAVDGPGGAEASDGSGSGGAGSPAAGGPGSGGVHAAATMLADGAALQAPLGGAGGAAAGPGV
ncbi:hypothetical protein ACFWJW_21925, partial [Streptomyces sp. NPDC127097]